MIVGILNRDYYCYVIYCIIIEFCLFFIVYGNYVFKVLVLRNVRDDFNL